MALLSSCCCWKSIRSGSLGCAVYTLIFHTVVLTASVFHIGTVREDLGMFIFTIIMAVLSSSCVISSILLIIGVCTNNRHLLMPWIVAIALTTLLDVVLTFYLVIDSIFDLFLAILFVVDILICALNVYCLLCVLSLYQSYRAGSAMNVMENAVHHQVQFTTTPVKKNAPKISLMDEMGSDNSAPSSQQPQRRLLAELSTITEERNATTSTDVSTLGPDSRSVSPSLHHGIEPERRSSSNANDTLPLLASGRKDSTRGVAMV